MGKSSKEFIMEKNAISIMQSYIEGMKQLKVWALVTAHALCETNEPRKAASEAKNKLPYSYAITEEYRKFLEEWNSLMEGVEKGKLEPIRAVDVLIKAVIDMETALSVR